MTGFRSIASMLSIGREQSGMRGGRGDNKSGEMEGDHVGAGWHMITETLVSKGNPGQ
jgi:hypothetical protein